MSFRTLRNSSGRGGNRIACQPPGPNPALVAVSSDPPAAAPVAAAPPAPGPEGEEEEELLEWVERSRPRKEAKIGGAPSDGCDLRDHGRKPEPLPVKREELGRWARWTRARVFLNVPRPFQPPSWADVEESEEETGIIPATGQRRLRDSS